FLIFVGFGTLVLMAGFVALLVWAQRSGAKHQEKFFTTVISGDPEQVLALCDPQLQEEIDAPVLGAWMNAVRKQLGPYRGLSAANFNTNMNSTPQGTIITSKGTVNFEHGDAHSELAYRNSLLTSFSIESDKLGDWFQGPTSTELYRGRGEHFIRT